MGDPESKASGFNSMVQTLRRLVPPDAFERFVTTLPAETAEVIRHPPLALAWIPTAHFRAVSRAARTQLFGEDDERIVEWGRQAVLQDLRTIYKMFIRFMSPQFVIERGTRLWATYQRNFGKVSSRPEGDQAAIVEYTGLPLAFVNEGFWAYQRGALRGIMEATGMNGIVVDTVDGAGTAGHARFRVSWL